MDELLDAIIEGLKKRGGELPEITLIDMELVSTPKDGLECRIQGTEMTKKILKSLEISNEDLDKMLRPAAKCLKGFADYLIEKMDEKNEEMRKEIFSKISKMN